jgi:hypothetical protein
MLYNSSLADTWCIGDEDQERRTQAEVLLNAYSRELERKRLAAGAAGLFSLDDSKFGASYPD